MDHSNIWDKTKVLLKDRLPAHAFETWFEPIKPLDVIGPKLVLQVPNQFFSEWVDMHYRKHIISTLKGLGDGSREIKYVISTKGTSPSEKTAELALRSQQLIAHETGIADVVDPFSGSYYIESLTDLFIKN